MFPVSFYHHLFSNKKRGQFDIHLIGFVVCGIGFSEDEGYDTIEWCCGIGAEVDEMEGEVGVGVKGVKG